MRENNIDFQNKELPTNILALLLVTTRRPQSEWRIGDTVCSPQQSDQHQFDDDWRRTRAAGSGVRTSLGRENQNAGAPYSPSILRLWASNTNNSRPCTNS